MVGGIKKRGERDDYCCSTLDPTDALVERNNKRKEKRAAVGWQLRRRKYDIRSIDIFQLLSVKTRPAAPKSQPSELYLFFFSLCFPPSIVNHFSTRYGLISSSTTTTYYERKRNSW